MQPLKHRLAIASGVGVAVLLGTSFGVFDLLEWAIRDEFFRLRPLEPVTNRVVVVTIDEPDIQAVGDWPIPDQVLADLLIQIRDQQPLVIGLDLYRDLPEGNGHEALIDVFRSTPSLIGIEKIIDNRISPPAILAELDQTAIADLVVDGDGNVRRALLTAQDEQDGNILKFGLATKAALQYLEDQGITPQVDPNDPQRLRLGQATFSLLQNRSAGYSEASLGGYQILMNWRGPGTQFAQVSMQDVLSGQLPPDLMRDRIVYIGSVAASTNDFFDVPYTHWYTDGDPMAGVFIHANLTSQMIESALNGRPLLRGGAADISKTDAEDRFRLGHRGSVA
ncbi:MAG: CHASE2 domain-containing protein, partial [Cyanothece sp. SIO2G6]|nr:CHASE2 domain-containing protein [Cyanothece sp. SIO2G6]